MDIINLTTNLKLGKPNIDEKYDVQVQNRNMDMIDSSIKKLQDADHNFATNEILQEHTGNKNNPHGVTKQQVGLDKVVNRQQIYGIPGTVTAGGIPIFDGNGYTVRDSGFTIGKSVPPNAVFTDTTYGIAGENVPGIIKSSDSIQVSSDGTASVVDESHSHDSQYYTKSDSLKLNNETLRESKNYTDLKIGEHNADSIIQKQIVDQLPTSNINTNIIYLVPKANASSGSNDNYNEYINLNGETTGWEFIGNTYIDLADYYNKSETNRIFFLNSNISQNNENERNKVPSSALLHYVLQEKDLQIQNLQNEISKINSNLTDIRYGTANLVYSNAAMLTCMLSFDRNVKAVAVTRHRVNDMFTAAYGASDIVIGAGILDEHYGGRGVQLRMYSFAKNFTDDISCPFCYIAVLGD